MAIARQNLIKDIICIRSINVRVWKLWQSIHDENWRSEYGVSICIGSNK